MGIASAAVALVVVALAAVVTTIVLRGRPSAADAAVSGRFLSLVSLTAVATLASSVMYFLYGFTGTTVTLAAGDAAMVLGPALMWLALRALHGIPARRGALLVGAVGLAVALATGLLPPAPAAFLKVAALLAFSAAAAVAAATGPYRHRLGTRVMATTFAVYAVFSAGRIVAALVGGLDSVAYRALFSLGPTTVMGVACVGAVTAGLVLFLRGLRAGPRADVRARFAEHARALLAAAGALDWSRVLLVDVALLRAADEHARADRVAEALREACEAEYGDGAVLAIDDEVVAVVAAGEGPGREERIRARFAAAVGPIDVSLADAVRFEARTIVAEPALSAALRMLRAGSTPE